MNEIVATNYESKKERSRRLKQLPIHVLVSDVLQHHELGTTCHELALQYLSKWKETHDEAAKSHQINEQLREDRGYWLGKIRALQDDLMLLKHRHDILFSLCEVLKPNKLMLE